MAIHTSTRPAGGQEECRIRIAAAGDVHYGREADRERVGEVPVYNVSVPVMGEDFWVFEMTGSPRVPSEVH